MKLSIDLAKPAVDNEPRSFAPGDSLDGTVRWESDEEVQELEVSLLFESKGKGTPQREVYASETFDTPSMSGEVAFSFTAADWPWTFSGKLISLVWLIRASARKPSGQVELPVIISPSRSEIDLYAYKIECEPLGSKWFRSQKAAVLRSKRGR